MQQRSVTALMIGVALASTGCDELRDYLHGVGGPGSHGHGHAGSSGGSAGSGAAGSGSPEPTLPEATADCPTIETGLVEFNGIPVRLWVGETRDDAPGPLLFYWHGTGSSPAEAESFFGAQVEEVLTQGGVVAALAGTTEEGEITSTGTWYTGDYAIADEVVACAVAQRNLDPRRIYATGCSSGAVHAGVMAYERSSYLASAATNSGGQVQAFELEDPAYTPALLAVHGDPETDIVIINFADASVALAEDIANKGGFAAICNHGGGHCAAPPELRAAQWQFLEDHPYGVSPEPYASALPAEFPSYCRIAGN